MLKIAFELTLERGEVINILGMTVHMERDKGRAVIKQKRFVDKLTPATADLLYEREDSELMGDQRKFMSLNATLMYASIWHRSTTKLRKAIMVRQWGSRSISWDVGTNIA